MGSNTEVVENPYGIESLMNAGWISKSLLITLLIMSMLSWFIALTKMWDQRRLNKQYGDVQKEANKGGFWSGNLRDSVDKLKGKDNTFKNIADEGLRAAEHHEGHLSDQMALHEWISITLQRSVDQVSSRMSSGLWFLATVGSTAPFVGLMGTVYGIYNALVAISASGAASLEKTAGPIGEALLMTLIGLFVAVPSVFFYNVLLRRNKAILEKTRYFASSVHSYLVSTTRATNGRK